MKVQESLVKGGNQGTSTLRLRRGVGGLAVGNPAPLDLSRSRATGRRAAPETSRTGKIPLVALHSGKR